MVVRRAGHAVLVTALALTVFGCASPGTPDGSASGLTEVREADFADKILYMDFRVSNAPMTAEELGDTSEAIPVGVRFHESFAVAWHAPNGRARVGDPDSVIMAWRLLETAETVEGDVRPEDAPTPVAPAVGVPGFELHDVVETPTPTLPIELAPTFHLDWLEDYNDEFIYFWGGHPGCITA